MEFFITSGQGLYVCDISLTTLRGVIAATQFLHDLAENQ
jgi:hypothetical protein